MLATDVLHRILELKLDQADVKKKKCGVHVSSRAEGLRIAIYLFHKEADFDRLVEGLIAFRRSMSDDGLF